jgi:hypothetical protein
MVDSGGNYDDRGNRVECLKLAEGVWKRNFRG